MTPHKPTEPQRAASAADAGQLDARALARSRRDAMLRRARRIRRSVAATAATVFAAAFLVIYVQLASGHDPALSTSTKGTSAASTEATGTTASSSGTSESSSSLSSSSGESSSSSESSESSESAAPVTTSQS
jgi:hypothetical protein